MGKGFDFQSFIFGKNWREELYSEIFKRAKELGKVKEVKFGDSHFQYALINPADCYGRTSTNPYNWHLSKEHIEDFIENLERGGAVGFGEYGLEFVLERSLPRPDFADYIGLHEYMENIQSQKRKNKRGRHGEACRIELEEVFKREPEFIDAYANWLLDLPKSKKGGYFGRAIPSFLITLKIIEGTSTPTEILREFKRQLDAGYHLKNKYIHNSNI